MAASPDPARSTAPYTPRWDPDPVVLCSRRSRIIPFPTLVLLREPTDADRKALEAPPELGKLRDEGQMAVAAGVNFLGTLTTAWDPAMYRAPSSQAAPKSPPNLDRCLLVAPSSRNVQLDKRPGFVDHETKLVKPEAVHAAWTRVLNWLRAEEQRQIDGPEGRANVPLFVAEQGFDAPEFVVCRLSEVLSQRTTTGGHAYQHAQGAIAHAKHGGQLGALHDYAVRTQTGWTLAVACRARAAAAPSLLPRG